MTPRGGGLKRKPGRDAQLSPWDNSSAGSSGSPAEEALAAQGAKEGLEPAPPTSVSPAGPVAWVPSPLPLARTKDNWNRLMGLGPDWHFSTGFIPQHSVSLSHVRVVFSSDDFVLSLSDQKF